MQVAGYDKAKFVERIEKLWRDGLTQNQIAGRLSITKPTLLKRLADCGRRFERGGQLGIIEPVVASEGQD